MLKCDTVCFNGTAEGKDHLKIPSCNNVWLNGWLGCLRAGLKQRRLLGAKAFHCSMFDSVPHPSEGDKLNSLRFTVMTFQNNEFVCSVQKLKLLLILSGDQTSWTSQPNCRKSFCLTGKPASIQNCLYLTDVSNSCSVVFRQPTFTGERGSLFHRCSPAAKRDVV